MFPIVEWWKGFLEFPLSGDVSQWIAPVTSWFSPNIALNVGNTQIEQEVVREVATYGKQLGVLSDLVLKMAEGNEALKDVRELTQLKEIAERIGKIKTRYQKNLKDKAMETLDELKAKDPEALKNLLKEYSKPA
jgi:heterodisulfide reductase subunit C